jgi:hypothetical protein
MQFALVLVKKTQDLEFVKSTIIEISDYFPNKSYFKILTID